RAGRRPVGSSATHHRSRSRSVAGRTSWWTRVTQNAGATTSFRWSATEGVIGCVASGCSRLTFDDELPTVRHVADHGFRPRRRPARSGTTRTGGIGWLPQRDSGETDGGGRDGWFVSAAEG